MRGVVVTRFGDFDDPIKMAKQLAESVNRIERLLEKLPIYYGEFDPNGQIVASAGSLFVRTGAQGENQVTATPHIYIKTQQSGSNGWLSLLYLGAQDQTQVSAQRGSLYLKIPSELALSASLFLKSSDDYSATGWTAL